MSYRKVVKKMNQSDVLTIMLTSIKEDNYLMAKQIGMTEEEIKESFDKSENGLSFIVMNLYNRMKEKGIIS